MSREPEPDVIRQLALAVVGKLAPWKLAGDDEVRKPTFMVVNDDWYEPLLAALGIEPGEPQVYHEPRGECPCGVTHGSRA